jgi:hypothetical protein
LWHRALWGGVSWCRDSWRWSLWCWLSWCHISLTLRLCLWWGDGPWDADKVRSQTKVEWGDGGHVGWCWSICDKGKFPFCPRRWWRRWWWCVSGGSSLLAMRSRSCSRRAAMRSSSVLYLRGMMCSITINVDAYDDGHCRQWRQLLMMGMVGGNGRRGWEQERLGLQTAGG